MQLSGASQAKPGSLTSLYLILYDSPSRLSEIHLALAFDTSLMRPIGLIPGKRLGNLCCAWGELGYRVEPLDTNDVHLSVLRIDARAGQSAFGAESGCFSASAIPDTVFELRLLPINGRADYGAFLPLDFVWTDCDDNVLIDVSGDTVYTAFEVKDCNYETIPLSAGKPGRGGPPVECATDDGPARRVPRVSFCNGGIEVADMGTPVGPGDVNGDWCVGCPLDVALFARMMVEPPASFVGMYESEMKATDMNCDGRQGTVEDFACLLGEAGMYLRPAPACAHLYGRKRCTYLRPGQTPPPEREYPPSPTADSSEQIAEFTVDPEKRTVLLSTLDTLAVVYLEFEGEINCIQPDTLLAANRKVPAYLQSEGEVECIQPDTLFTVNRGVVDGNTRMLIYPRTWYFDAPPVFIRTGPLISTDREVRLLRVKAATRMGQPVRCRITGP